ncbi:hypothetical protein BU24DRAFT_359538 [Aaosphaeria arxii CBS 175.79]|uniref:Proteophosphoglycan 5 n=1 Tax=Aaosphaeria arxii CBS 175.79 TaxID=1450172 RepID=A0A6A5X7V2_9PLEO|nr:uncharacterized protein BU24DRAFT_359538 [Aaosphaeria arxii CBS 175.79]KAF2008834.1 hypothetical protein BU24DRAFT_359538 [Aaosphaeria arxii CBS 175.79]
MSTTQPPPAAASPRGPRPRHHQHSKSATQVPPNNANRNPQRRHKGNRTTSGNPNNHRNAADVAGNSLYDTQNPIYSDSAVVSSEEMPVPAGSRSAKKHHNHSSHAHHDRVLSPQSTHGASLTDSEAIPNNASATPAKDAPAYAGPTFHASPAPSALPIPKFLSKSVPAKSRGAPPTPPDDSPASTSPPSPFPPSPSRAPVAVPPRHENSPLDMLFKADRAEKAKNATHSPGPNPHMNPSDPFTSRTPHHSKHGSQGSMNAIFPIELDASAQHNQTSPPASAPVPHRSNTEPSKMPSAKGNAPAPGNDSGAIQDLFDRLSLSQKKSMAATTPPRTGDQVPSESSPHHQSPSFHRSVSGPSTPAPAPQEQQSNFFYGNRNLSPLFKAAAKPDGTPRNSGLRTEITADSPLIGQGEFPSNYLQQAFRPNGPRRGSAPQVQQYRESPDNRKPRGQAQTPGRNQYKARPNSHTHAQQHHPGANNGKPVNVPKSNPFIPSSVQAATVPKANPFVPSSVQAKKYPSSPSKAPDSSSLEQDLKRLLNVKMGDSAGVR